MMRPEHEPSFIQHFSHPHPLQLIDPQILTAQCAGCELQPSGCMYACTMTDCKFTLHLSCAKMPQLINHPSHPSHPLTLLLTPPYPNGMFTCNGCRLPGRGFCFSTHCNFDVHIRCASNATNVPHAQTQTLYHVQHYNSFPGGYHQIQNGNFRPSGVNNFAHGQSMGMYQNSQVGRYGVASGIFFVGAAVQGFVLGAAQQVGQYFMHSLMDDGSGGGGTSDPDGGNGMGFGSSNLGGFFDDSSS